MFKVYPITKYPTNASRFRIFYPFFFQTIGTKPVAHIDQFTPDMLGSAELAEEVNLNGSGKLIKVSDKTFTPT